MRPSENWWMSLVLEKRVFGQAILLFSLKSKDIEGPTSHQVCFTSVDWMDLLKSGGKTAARGLSPMAALRNLIGTGTGPLSRELVQVRCERPFAAEELKNVEGYVDGGSAGFAFGYCDFTVAARSLFTCEISGVTASMMFPTYGKTEGKWHLLSGVTAKSEPEKPFVGDVNINPTIRSIA